MARRPARGRSGARPATLGAGRAVALLLGAGAAAGLVYNVLAPRGIFAPEPVAADWSADGQQPAAPGATAVVESVPARRAAAPAHAVRRAAPTRTVTGQAAVTPPPPAAVAPRVIDLAEAESLARARAAAFVDARSPENFKLGHIPRAINLPSTEFPAAFARERGRLDPAAPTVVYCTSEECDESDLVVEQLVKAGFTHLLHFKQGWNAWENANLPQEK